MPHTKSAKKHMRQSAKRREANRVAKKAIRTQIKKLMDVAKKVVAGESVPTRIETKETTFDQEQAKAALPTRQY